MERSSVFGSAQEAVNHLSSLPNKSGSTMVNMDGRVYELKLTTKSYLCGLFTKNTFTISEAEPLSPSTRPLFERGITDKPVNTTINSHLCQSVTGWSFDGKRKNFSDKRKTFFAKRVEHAGLSSPATNVGTKKVCYARSLCAKILSKICRKGFQKIEKNAGTTTLKNVQDTAAADVKTNLRPPLNAALGSFDDHIQTIKSFVLETIQTPYGATESVRKTVVSGSFKPEKANEALQNFLNHLEKNTLSEDQITSSIDALYDLAIGVDSFSVVKASTDYQNLADKIRQTARALRLCLNIRERDLGDPEKGKIANDKAERIEQSIHKNILRKMDLGSF